MENKEKDRPKTVFSTRPGLFQFRQMPFGLACTPATFDRMMERVLERQQLSIYLIYQDDVIVIYQFFEEMIKNLRSVFDKLKGSGLKFKPKKCTPFAKKVIFLGHVVTREKHCQKRLLQQINRKLPNAQHACVNCSPYIRS